MIKSDKGFPKFWVLYSILFLSNNLAINEILTV